MSRSRVHASLAFLTVALLCCTSWGRPVGSSTLDPQRLPGRLRLTFKGGRRVEMLRASVSGDTLYGDTLGPSRLFLGPRRIPAAIPVVAIDSVASRGLNVPMTLLAVAAVTGAVVVVTQQAHEAEERSKQSCNAPCVDC